MASLNETPGGNRIRLAVFGLRNAGKSTLVNELTGQSLAIVSDVPGTTTDPVSKAMEILPLGPCLVTDTAGLDDVGELGSERVKRTLDVLGKTDIAIWVSSSPAAGDEPIGEWEKRFREECAARKVVTLDYRRGGSVEELKRRIASVKIADEGPGLLEGLVKKGDRVVCVCPIDGSAPKGRLILPQVQVIRACLDIGAVCTVCQPAELAASCAVMPNLVITDSQAFAEVTATLREIGDVRLTSFSILFARQKGDVAAYQNGLAAIPNLKDGDRVLIAEGCTHHRQCNDIGTVKIPCALSAMSKRKLVFDTCNGGTFPVAGETSPYALVVQCGGCMLTRREVQDRIARCRRANVPIVNYGMLLRSAAIGK